jgi:nucleoside-diphosphate-sugar epimerase
MAVVAHATAFVTGASGFVGTELTGVLTAGGHEVFGVTDSLDGAQRVRHPAAPARSHQ